MTILFLISFLSVSIVHQTLVSTSYYPSGSVPCKLYNHTNADCSHRQLNRVPVIHDDSIKTFDLSHNKLGNLGGKAHFKQFGLLTALNLSNNQITGFDNATFQGLKSLLTLDLSNHNIIEIHGEPFKHLSLLLTLYLYGTCTDSPQKTLFYIAPSAFTGLFNLQHLDLKCNVISSLPADIFANLTKLRYLDIGSSNLKQISARFPASLQTLNLSSLDRSSIEPKSFMNSTNLLELTLYHENVLRLLPDDAPIQRLFRLNNRHNIGPDFFQSLRRFRTVTSLNLRFSCTLMDLTSFELLDATLDHLSLSYFQCQNFDTSTFQPLAKWNISMIHLDILNSARCCQKQGFQHIKDHSFSLFTNLQKLTISKHFLSHLSQHAFNGLTKLQELDLSNNRISVIPQPRGALKYESDVQVPTGERK